MFWDRKYCLQKLLVKQALGQLQSTACIAHSMALLAVNIAPYCVHNISLSVLCCQEVCILVEVIAMLLEALSRHGKTYLRCKCARCSCQFGTKEAMKSETIKVRKYLDHIAMADVTTAIAMYYFTPSSRWGEIICEQVDLTKCSLVLNTYFCSTRLSSLSKTTFVRRHTVKMRL